MVPYAAVTAEGGALASDGANAPPMPVDNTSIWTAQLLKQVTPARPVIVATNGGGVSESIPSRTTPIGTDSATPGIVFRPRIITTVAPPKPIYDPRIITTTGPDVNSGVSINPSPVADATTTPTPINAITGERIPAPTTSVLQAAPGAAVTPPKLTRNEIIALVVLAALVIL